jgi:hypothetical protein
VRILDNLWIYIYIYIYIWNGVNRGVRYIPKRKIVDGTIFVVYNILLTISLIFLTLLLLMCLKLNTYYCMLIIKKKNCREGHLIVDLW